MLIVTPKCPCGCGLVQARQTINSMLYAAAISEPTPTPEPFCFGPDWVELDRFVDQIGVGMFIDCQALNRERAEWLQPFLSAWRRMQEQCPVEREGEAA